MACKAVRHGTINAYCRDGCRCPEAVKAKRRYDKLRLTYPARFKRVDAAGCRRRIQALVAIGWPMDVLAARVGESPSAIRHVIYRKYVYLPTVRKVTRLYDELSMIQGPSNLSRLAAARKGWPPPLAWDDDLIDDPTAVPVGANGVPFLVAS